jgi:hypothetical protein
MDSLSVLEEVAIKDIFIMTEEKLASLFTVKAIHTLPPKALKRIIEINSKQIPISKVSELVRGYPFVVQEPPHLPEG